MSRFVKITYGYMFTYLQVPGKYVIKQKDESKGQSNTYPKHLK